MNPSLPPPEPLPTPPPSRPLHLEPLPLHGRALALRAATLRSLATFAETFIPGWRAAPFHELLAERLDACLRRDIKRLIVNVPPQHGKSLLTSVAFPAWALTRFPSLRIFQAGHTGELSRRFTRDGRTLVTSPLYRSLHPDLIGTRVSREEYWETRLGGYYYATSVGGGTGMPADLLLIDDPHRDRAEANSPTQRDRVWEWFTSTAMTRLAPDGVVIVVQTRWHPDDLAGRLQHPDRVRQLEQAGCPDMRFQVLSLEALCENPATDPLHRSSGEALWPAVRPAAWLRAQQILIGPQEWHALYQQRPHPPGGHLCDIRKIKIIPRSAVPPLQLVRGWDLAISQATTADYSVGAYGGVRLLRQPLPDGRSIDVPEVYLVHLDRGKRTWPEQKARIVDYATAIDRSPRICLEAVRGWEVAAQELRSFLHGRAQVQDYRPAVDKVTRALPWLATIEAGNFYMVEGTWNQAFLDELERFPHAEHDDQIDATTVMFEAALPRPSLLLA